MKQVRFKLGDDVYLVGHVQAVSIQTLLDSEDESERARGEKILKQKGTLFVEGEPEPEPEEPKPLVTQGMTGTGDLPK